jgi:hypothetical protein
MSTRWCTIGSAQPISTICSSPTVTSTYPSDEHERFVAHFRGLIGAWLADRA